MNVNLKLKHFTLKTVGIHENDNLKIKNYQASDSRLVEKDASLITKDWKV